METNGINSRAAGYAAYTGAARVARQEGAAKTATNTGAASAQRTRDVFEMSDEELRDAMTLRPGEDGQYHASKEHAAAGLERTRRDLVNKYGESQSSLRQRSDDRMLANALKAAEEEGVDGKENGTVFMSHIEADARVVDQIKNVIREYYSDAHAETMRFSGGNEGEAWLHVANKYRHANSPYFRSDLSERERELAYKQEIEMLRKPEGSESFYLDDEFALQSIGGPPDAARLEMMTNRLQRNQIDGALQKLFDSNGVKMPEGKSVKFSVNPYDYDVEVSGLSDSGLAGTIRNLLNTGTNGRALYSMLRNADPSRLGLEQPEQYAALNQEKISFFHAVKTLTGLDVRTLDRKDGAFLTPDGKDLWNVMLESAKRLKNGDGNNGISIDNLKDAYQKYAREGWGGNESLSIEYKDGHLYDIGTKYGYGPGQMDWQKSVYNNPDPYNKAYMARVDAAAQELEVQGRDDENAARMA